MADTPGEGEAAQALFCAMADYIGVSKLKQVLNLDKYPTYTSFKRDNKKLIEDSFSKRVHTPTISLQRIENFLLEDSRKGSPPNGWYVSSVNIAIKLITDIDKIFKVRDFEDIKINAFNKKYIIGTQCKRKVSNNTSY